MNTFDLLYSTITLRIICENEFTHFIKNHFNGYATIILKPLKDPTYILVISNSLPNPKGNYTKMVDKWFNYATLDCWIDNSNKTCYVSNIQADSNRNKELLIQYFVGNLFNRLLELKGYIGIHSSCVEKDNKGILFIGERKAGKTTCMLNLMNAGFNSVTNEKVAVKHFINKIEAYGISQSVSIRMSKNFSMQPSNHKYVEIAKSQGICYTEDAKLEENRIVISPIELAELNNVKQVPSTEIKSVLFPRYNSELKTSRFTLLDKLTSTQIIKSQLMSLVHDTTLFLRNVIIESNDICTSDECISYLTELPCYLCEQNEYTTTSFISGVNKILEIPY